MVVCHKWFFSFLFHSAHIKSDSLRKSQFHARACLPFRPISSCFDGKSTTKIGAALEKAHCFQNDCLDIMEYYRVVPLSAYIFLLPFSVFHPFFSNILSTDYLRNALVKKNQIFFFKSSFLLCIPSNLVRSKDQGVKTKKESNLSVTKSTHDKNRKPPKFRALFPLLTFVTKSLWVGVCYIRFQYVLVINLGKNAFLTWIKPSEFHSPESIFFQDTWLKGLLSMYK